MDVIEQTIGSKEIFRGKVLNLRVDEVKLPDGRTASREVVEHPGAVAILAMVEGKVILVRQYRYAIGRCLWEIPAGKLEAGEEPLFTAQRELQEETGYSANNWIKLYEFYTSAGFSNELMHLYLATDISEGEINPDDDEFIEAVSFSTDQLHHLLDSGDIQDAKTIIALNWLFRRDFTECVSPH